MNFDNKHILVTGAAGGIGQAVVRQLLNRGALVSLMDCSDSALHQFAAPLQAAYPSQLNLCPATDISSAINVQQQINSLVEQKGELDGLVHAAAALTAAPLLEMSAADFERLIQVNLQGSFNILQAVGRRMMAQHSGAIVVIGSNSATTPRLNIGAYGASKAGVHMLVKNFALELSQAGVRCNLVSPGSTRTEMLVKTWRDDYGEAETIAGDQDKYRLGIPLGKIAEPDDIANAVRFLLSDEANHITMHDMRIDGGATLNQMG